MKQPSAGIKRQPYRDVIARSPRSCHRAFVPLLASKKQIKLLAEGRRLQAVRLPGWVLFDVGRCLAVSHCLQAFRFVMWFVCLVLASSGTTARPRSEQTDKLDGPGVSL
jgi:hypothetical protein